MKVMDTNCPKSRSQTRINRQKKIRLKIFKETMNKITSAAANKRS